MTGGNRIACHHSFVLRLERLDAESFFSKDGSARIRVISIAIEEVYG
jgi:hypothetical protein